MDRLIVNVVRRLNAYVRDQFLMKALLKYIHIYILNKLIISRKMKKILIQLKDIQGGCRLRIWNLKQGS